MTSLSLLLRIFPSSNVYLGRNPQFPQKTSNLLRNIPVLEQKAHILGNSSVPRKPRWLVTLHHNFSFIHPLLLSFAIINSLVHFLENFTLIVAVAC